MTNKHKLELGINASTTILGQLLNELSTLFYNNPVLRVDSKL